MVEKGARVAALPHWWHIPRHLNSEQFELFREPMTAVLARERISPNELDRWNEAGWASCRSSHEEPLQWQESEPGGCL